MYVLLDHTKINPYAPFVVCMPQEIHTIIADNKAAQNAEKRSILRKCNEDGVKLLFAEA